MKIKNLNKLINDYEKVFNTSIDDCGINEILEDVQYKCNESCVREGEVFCLEEKLYKKNGFGFLDAEIILFNFEVISRNYKYITDEDTGEQVVDMVEEEIVEYLGYN